MRRGRRETRFYGGKSRYRNFRTPGPHALGFGAFGDETRDGIPGVCRRCKQLLNCGHNDTETFKGR